MNYGFVITRQGLDLITKLLIPTELVLTRVMVGNGRLPENPDPVSFTDLISPIAQATSTAPIVNNHQLEFTVEYRNDMNGGLETGFWLNEFGIFAQDPDIGEILLYYATLGDYPQWVQPFSPGMLDVRRYPISIGLSNDATVVLQYPAVAFLTAEDLDNHNQNPAAHEGNFWTTDTMRRVNTTTPLNPDYFLYVSPDGDDETGDGTQNNPYATINKAVETGSQYTRDSQVEIRLEEGDYYDVPNLEILAHGRVSIEALSGRAKLHFNEGAAVRVSHGAVARFANIDFICNYALPASGWFLLCGGSSSALSLLFCSVQSSVTQSNASATAVLANAGLLNIFNDANQEITGFHDAVRAAQGGRAYVQTPGSAMTNAYLASGSVIYVNSGGGIPAIQGGTVEGVGGRVRMTFQQGFNNTITIYVSPDGDDRNWGHSTAFPVATLARAMTIAQRCEGTGTVRIQLADGVYTNTNTASFTGITRRVELRGNPANPGAVVVNHSIAASCITAASCLSFYVMGLTINRTVQGAADSSVISITGGAGRIEDVVIAASAAQTNQTSYGIIATGANVRIARTSVSNMGTILHANNGALISLAGAVAGTGNTVGYSAFHGIILFSGTSPTAATPLVKSTGGGAC